MAIPNPNFFDRLGKAQKRNKSLLCLGLDPEPSKLPDIFKKRNAADVARFNKAILESCGDLICAVKPNWAFYEAMGIDGLKALEKTLEAVPSGIPIIADAKRGDIG
ncbi:TPA: orotidine 5'-phosphate decarboxylase, partial [Candidatus Sumerlaeota bacterium]|nr:orotidine 5'-phosphate decarboxylase [Candidatus Sumerlaeota bacterium]